VPRGGSAWKTTWDDYIPPRRAAQPALAELQGRNRSAAGGRADGRRAGQGVARGSRDAAVIRRPRRAGPSRVEMPAPDVAAAAQAMQEDLARALEPALQRLRAAREEGHAAIDTAEEYRRLGRVCPEDQRRCGRRCGCPDQPTPTRRKTRKDSSVTPC
jgi:hypothetical protein